MARAFSISGSASANVLTLTRFTFVITSPGRKPRSAAGLPGSTRATNEARQAVRARVVDELGALEHGIELGCLLLRRRRGNGRCRRELAEHGSDSLLAAVANQAHRHAFAGRQETDRVLERARVAQPRAVDADDDVLDLNSGAFRSRLR